MHSLEFLEGHNVTGCHGSLLALVADIAALTDEIDRLKADKLNLQEQVADLEAELSDLRMGVAA